MASTEVIVSLVAVGGAMAGHLVTLWSNQNSGAVALLAEYRTMFAALRGELIECKRERDEQQRVLNGIAMEVLSPEQRMRLFPPRPMIERG